MKIEIVKKGSDDNAIDYWLSLSPIERLIQLEEIRSRYNKWKYASEPGLQRVCKIIKSK